MSNSDSEKFKPEIEIYTLSQCPYCNKAKTFLQSKGLTYQEINIEASDENKKEMLTRTGGAKTVPQIFIDGKHIGGYDDLIAKKKGGELEELMGPAVKHNFEKNWDLTIIGAGPAGLNAALYGARKGLEILLISEALGGQMAETGEVDNYLGLRNTTGPDLLQSFWKHVLDYNISIELGEKAAGVKKEGTKDFYVNLASGKQIHTGSLIIASGTSNRELGVPGEQELRGKGVHYCATCDGYLYSGQPVAVVGGGNAGLEAAVDLANIGCQVELIEIQKELTGDQILCDKVRNREEINIHTSHRVDSINEDDSGRGTVSLVTVDKENNKEQSFDVNGVFIEIGLIPNTDFIKETVEVNKIGEIIIDSNNKTSVPGIWAAGDVTNIKDKQIIISAAEGAKAALRVNEYLS